MIFWENAVISSGPLLGRGGPTLCSLGGNRSMVYEFWPKKVIEFHMGH